jgi:hypothetical protein
LTSTFEPTESVGPFIPPNIIIPRDWGEAQLILTDYLLKIAEAINAREIATYQDATLSSGVNVSETVNGQAWFTPGDVNKYRYGSRTVVNFGTLPNNTTTSVAHGITVSSNTVFTRIYGVATDPSTSFIPLPFVDTAGNHVELNVDATNVNIVTTADYTGYTTAYVVLEYIESV